MTLNRCLVASIFTAALLIVQLAFASAFEEEPTCPAQEDDEIPVWALFLVTFVSSFNDLLSNIAVPAYFTAV